MRLFLESFRIPGEAQKIERVWKPSAWTVSAQSASIFANADAVFVFAFSVMMLNTLHNPHVTDRMTMRYF